MYFDHVTLYYPLPSLSSSCQAPASPWEAPPTLNLSCTVPWGFCMTMGGWLFTRMFMNELSVAISMYLSKILNGRVLYGVKGGTTNTELWFCLASARWRYCIYSQGKHSHNCLIVYKLGEVGSLIVLTKIFSAFDISLSQDEWIHCSVGVCMFEGGVFLWNVEP